MGSASGHSTRVLGRFRWATSPAAGLPPANGFLLPLASGGALLLLLSCLSLQSLIWGRQLEGRGAWQQRQIDDRLSSAAHRLAVAFNHSHRCLLLVPSGSWAAISVPGCGSSEALLPLLQIPVATAGAPDGAVRLVSWQPQVPDPGWGLLTLALLPDRQVAAAQRRYRLRLAAEPLRVSGVQELDP